MKFITWLTQSSANKDNIALTLKAGIPLIVSSILVITQQLNFTIDPHQLEAYLNSGVIIFSGILTLYGVLRKIYYALQEKEVVTFTKKKK